MRAGLRRSVLGFVLTVFVLGGACRDDRTGATEGPGTTTEGMGGLAEDEFEREVQPMTPEQAQELGIADTVPEPPPEGAPEEIPGAPPE
jgi:hypothetical protein